MAALSNHKHELFAQAVARGDSATAAYLEAGYSATGNAAEACASRLLSTAKVQLRIAELQARAAIKVELTVVDLVEMLVEDRALARECEQSGSAVSATMGIAKLLGHLKEKVELTGKDGGPLELREAARAEVAELFGPTPFLIAANGH